LGVQQDELKRLLSILEQNYYLVCDYFKNIAYHGSRHSKGLGRLTGLALLRAAAFTFIPRHQAALLGIELFFLLDLPFMKTGFTQLTAFVFFAGLGNFKFDNIAHHFNVA